VELHSHLLAVPGRLVPCLLDHLREGLPPHAHAALAKYQAAVQAAVVGGDAGAEDELRDGIEAVRAIGLSKGKGENKG